MFIPNCTTRWRIWARSELNESNAAYDAIHRSILAGLIGHVARFEERNNYKAAGNRLAFGVPRLGAVRARRAAEEIRRAQGSSGHRQNPSRSSRSGSSPVKSSKPPSFSRAPWRALIRSGSSSSRRTAAKLTHQNPHWSARAGNVLVEEIVTLARIGSAEPQSRHGNINPQEATEIFIRSALGRR